MPAHVQDLLVEVDLIRIGLLLHATAGAGRAAATAGCSVTTAGVATGAAAGAGVAYETAGVRWK